VERFWRLHSHWQPYGHCNKQDQAILYVCLYPDDGFTDHHLHGAGFLEKYQEIYLGGEEESMVLSLVNGEGEWIPDIYAFLLTIDHLLPACRLQKAFNEFRLRPSHL
jgi:hypothetical protein